MHASIVAPGDQHARPTIVFVVLAAGAGGTAGTARIQPVGCVGVLSAAQCIAVLLCFHALGWIHGDARIPNFCSTSNGAFLIDLANSKMDLSAALRRQDVGRFVCPWLKVDHVSQEQGWRAELQDKPTLEAAIDAMCPLNAADGHAPAPDTVTALVALPPAL